MSAIVNNYRLIDSEMFVTLEPCLMCLGAAVNARVKNILRHKRLKISYRI